MENFKVGDIVIFKEQNQGYKKTLRGGIVLAIVDNAVVLQRNHRPPTTYGKDLLRPLTSKDILEDGVEII